MTTNTSQVENKTPHDLNEQQTETAPGLKEANTDSLTPSHLIPADHSPTLHAPSDTAPLGFEGGELEEDDLLATSTGDNEVGKLLRTTVEELETALQVFYCLLVLHQDVYMYPFM